MSTAEDELRPPSERRWPRPWQAPFLHNLALIPDVSSAARAANIGRAEVYRRRNTDSVFREAWDECLEIAKDRVQQVAHTWITAGVPVHSRRTTTRTKKDKDGNVMETTTEVVESEARERSATLMIFWLKAFHPDRFRWAERVEATGRDGGPVEISPLESIDEQIAVLAAQIRERAGDEPVPVE